MRDNAVYVTEDGALVVDRSLVQVERESGYGSVPELDDEELADPAELERQVMLQDWAPVLAIPVETAAWASRPAVDESGGIVWGAFGTVDFSRLRPKFDPRRFKADKLGEQLRDASLILGIVRERLSPGARRERLERLRAGRMDPNGISDGDSRAYAKWYLRVQQLRQSIRELRGFRRRPRQQPAAVEMG
jgi:hypothetical protein